MASKIAIIGMTKTGALEQGARRIGVDAAAPGAIAGKMTFKLADGLFAATEETFAETVPLGRHGTPEDVVCHVSHPLFGRVQPCDRYHAFGGRRVHHGLGFAAEGLLRRADDA